METPSVPFGPHLQRALRFIPTPPSWSSRTFKLQCETLLVLPTCSIIPNFRRIPMIDPKQATQLVTDRLENATKEDMEKVVAKSQLSTSNSTDSQDESTQLRLFRPSDTPLPLSAYLACALTGVDADQRSLVFQISDSLSQICKKHSIDLYEPRKSTDPVHHPDMEDSEVFRKDRERVLGSDLLVFLGGHSRRRVRRGSRTRMHRARGRRGRCRCCATPPACVS